MMSKSLRRSDIYYENRWVTHIDYTYYDNCLGYLNYIEVTNNDSDNEYHPIGTLPLLYLRLSDHRIKETDIAKHFT